MLGLLEQIELEVRANITEYAGSRDFTRNWVHEVFKEKF